MRKRSRRGDGCAPEYVLQRDDSVWNPRRGSAAAQARCRRLPAIGLWLVSASLVSGLIWQVIWIVDVNRFVQSEDITSEDIDDLSGRPRGTVHLARVLVDVSGLGIPVQRRRCRIAGSFTAAVLSGVSPVKVVTLTPLVASRTSVSSRARFDPTFLITAVPAVSHQRWTLMFKRPSVRYGRTPEPETPYQKAAQVWDERIGSARVQAKNWRLMAFGCLMLSGGLASGLVWQSLRGTVTPWVVQVDHLGQAQAVAPADGSYQPTDPQIAFHLARFIEDVRGLPADGIVLRQDWLRAYDFTTDRGAAALNNYARTNDPFANLGKLQISVEVSSVIRASPASFRVAWIQRSYENGSLSATERWTAILTVVIDTPRDADRLRKNPLGVYVNAINWSKELGQ